MNTTTLIGQNSSLGEEVMTITVQKNCPGEEVMAHNLPLLYRSFILGGIYLYIANISVASQFSPHVHSLCVRGEAVEHIHT